MSGWHSDRIGYGPQYYNELLNDIELTINSSNLEIVHSYLMNNVDAFCFFETDGLIKENVQLNNKDNLMAVDLLSIACNLDSNDPTSTTTLIAIDLPHDSLVDVNGDLSIRLKNKIKEVKLWKNWVQENRKTFISKIVKTIEKEKTEYDLEKEIKDMLIRHVNYGIYDKYLIISGRREYLNISNRMMLAQTNKELDPIKIITYDALLSGIRKKIRFN